MAFTPDGMFYLSKEDYAPTIGLAGQGVRGMLGVQNKEEKLEQQKKDVDAIVKAADFNTDEGKAKALNDIKAVSTDAWMAFSKEINAMQTSDLALTAKKRTPELKAEWRLDVGKKFTTKWAADNIPGQPVGITDRTGLTKYLLTLVRANTMTNAEKNTWLKDYDASMKLGKDAYLSTNATRSVSPKGTISSKEVFNAGEYAPRVDIEGVPLVTPPTQEEYDADPRPVWQKGSIWNYRLPKGPLNMGPDVGGA